MEHHPLLTSSQVPISHPGLPLVEPTENQSLREPGKCNPQGQAPEHRAELGKRDGVMTNRERTGSAALAVGWGERFPEGRMASADIFESLLTHIATEGVSSYSEGDSFSVPIRRESRMALGGTSGHLPCSLER